MLRIARVSWCGSKTQACFVVRTGCCARGPSACSSVSSGAARARKRRSGSAHASRSPLTGRADRCSRGGSRSSTSIGRRCRRGWWRCAGRSTETRSRPLRGIPRHLRSRLGWPTSRQLPGSTRWVSRCATGSACAPCALRRFTPGSPWGVAAGLGPRPPSRVGRGGHPPLLPLRRARARVRRRRAHGAVGRVPAVISRDRGILS